MTTKTSGEPKQRWFERFAALLERVGTRNFFRKRVRIGGRRMIPRERGGAEEDYLERFYIFSTPWVGIYIHRFWADDNDGLHDHPWNSVSVLLAGAYNEEMPERQNVPYGPSIMKLRRPLHPLLHVRSKHAAHRITIPEGQEGTWSLFIRFGLKRRTWGFYRNRTWEPAEVQSRQVEEAR